MAKIRYKENTRNDLYFAHWYFFNNGVATRVEDAKTKFWARVYKALRTSWHYNLNKEHYEQRMNGWNDK